MHHLERPDDSAPPLEFYVYLFPPVACPDLLVNARRICITIIRMLDCDVQQLEVSSMSPKLIIDSQAVYTRD